MNRHCALLLALSTGLAACSSNELSDDPEIARDQVEEQVTAEAQTLEEAAAEAVEIQRAELQDDSATQQNNSIQ